MDIIEFREFCLGMEGVEEKMPFGKFARKFDSTLVFYVCGHMFALCDIDDFTSVAVRLSEAEIVELFQTKSAVGRPRNPALKLWASIIFGGDISDAEIYRLTRRAYEIVKAKYTAKTRSKS